MQNVFYNANPCTGSLHAQVKNVPSLETFKSQLKTYLFKRNRMTDFYV